MKSDDFDLLHKYISLLITYIAINVKINKQKTKQKNNNKQKTTTALRS